MFNLNDCVSSFIINRLRHIEPRTKHDTLFEGWSLENKRMLLAAEVCILLFFAVHLIQAPSEKRSEALGNPTSLFSSKFIVENMKGRQGGAIHWRIPEDGRIRINILNPITVDDSRVALIEDVIMSKEVIDTKAPPSKGSDPGRRDKYYFGWRGALESAPETKFPLPTEFSIISSRSMEGEIVIVLSNIKDRSGNIGYTKTILEGDEIIKAFITIYEANSLSSESLQTIVRHEFGHALGLDHTNTAGNLMAPVIDMTYPFISECNVATLVDKYNGVNTQATAC